MRDFDPSHVLDRKEMRRTDRYIQFGARRRAPGAGSGGPAGAARGRARRADRGHPRHRARRRRHARSTDVLDHARRGPDRISPFLIPMGIAEHRRRARSPSRSGCSGRTSRPSRPAPPAATRSASRAEIDPPRRRRRHARRRRGGRRSTRPSSAGSRRCGAVDAQRRSRRRHRGRSTRGRDGFVIGEGAGVARPRGADARRGARRRAARRARRATARRPTPRTSRCRRPAGSARVRAARRALEKAGLAPDDIDHVNAHATSTPEGDKAELQAIADDPRRARAGASRSRPTSRCSGHTLGAAGAIEAIATIQAIREGCVPPTINLVDPDPEARRAGPDPERRTRRAESAPRSATRSGSAARTPRWSSGG